AAGHRPWRTGRAESHVRRARGVSVQERPILFQRLRADGEAAGRSDSDGGLVVNIAVTLAEAGAPLPSRRFKKSGIPAFAGMTMLVFATPGAAQEKKPPYWASIASGQAMTRTGPAKNYPGIWLYQRRDLPIRVLKTYPNWRLIEDPDGIRGWMLVTLLSDRRTAIVKKGEPRPVRV